MPTPNVTIVESLRTGETAQALGIPVRLVRDLIAVGWLEGVRPPGSQWRISRASVARLRRGLPRLPKASA